ncbi:DUF4251 domain-containing protein [Sulfidibacter corallicola]|uniref:Uncharacterized protein n=1 Tax=Sulfidibacter corallicola TaxID=2818388 RepID=A0A8A4TVC2_SULCO|nr:choice-of-anchor Q domain-containing protein [Sulfidibacter corallicola]QTD50475.1 hypothetical protein J3U87_33240 [Sulfidibacter corallicola]
MLNKLPVFRGLLPLAVSLLCAVPPLFAANFEVTNLNASGGGSLTAAVTSANNNAGADTISFQAGLNGTITPSATLVINGPVSINGNTDGNAATREITISGGSARTIFRVNNNGDVEITDLNLVNGSSNQTDLFNPLSTGGAITVDGANGSPVVTVRRVNFENNRADFSGAIYVNFGGLVVSDCVFLNNISDGSASGGGAIGIFDDVSASSVSYTIDDSTFIGNQMNGGGVQNAGGGGHIWLGLNNDTMTVRRCHFEDGFANSGPGGGAILCTPFPVGSGGSQTAFLNVHDSQFINNRAINGAFFTGGGALSIRGGDPSDFVTSVITGNTFSGNSATAAGGAIEIWGAGTTSGGPITNQVTVNNNTFHNNTAESGGAVGFVNSVVTFDSNTVTNNTTTGMDAGTSHGSVYLFAGNPIGTFQMRNSILDGNSEPQIRSFGGVTGTSQGNNLINGTVLNLTGWANQASDITGTGANLAALAPNGLRVGASNNGFTAQTRVPNGGSSVISAGNTTLTVDQRGVARPIGTDDIGAVEVNQDDPTLDLDANNSSGATGNNFTGSFTPGGGGVAIADTDTAIGGSTDPQIRNATITLTTRPDGASESLALTSAGNTAAIAAGIVITPYNSGTGVLFLSGNATTSAYEAAIEAIRYDNALGSPTLTNRTITVQVDNDEASNLATATLTLASAGVSVVETGTTDVVEGGATDTYTIQLDSVPAGAVEITVTADSQTEVSLNGTDFASSQVFSRSDTTTQTITVRAVDDMVDEAATHTGTITQAITNTGDAADYPIGLTIDSVTVNVTDNDTAGVAVVQSGGTTDIAEGGATDTYTLALATVPSGAVQITVTADAQTEVSLDGVNFAASQNFSRSDTTSQTVTVRAIDDLVIESSPHTGTLSHAITASPDANYPTNLSINPVNAAITDNDTAAVAVLQSGGTTDIAEGGATDTYTLALATVPSGAVQITVTADAQTEVSLDGVNFAASQNFNRSDTTSQTVTVRAIDDLVIESSPHTGTLSHAITSSPDANYPTNLSINPVNAAITDNDTAGVAVVQSGGTTDIAEGGATDTYTLALATVPSGAVQITVTADAQTEVSLDGVNFAASQNFSRSDTTTQTVTVRAIDDLVIESSPHTGTLSHAITASPDANYPTNLSINPVNAAITDNDTAAVAVVQSGGTTDIAEGGATDTYTLALATVPSGAVQITVTADAQTEVSLDGVNFGASQNFSRSDTTSQTVTVRAIDDLVIESSPHTGTLSHAITASPDANYPTNLSINPVNAAITDNDTAGVATVQSGGTTDIAEGGATDTYTLALATVPTGAVQITVTADAQTEVSLDGVNFGASQNFSRSDTTTQTVTVRAIDDLVIESSPHTGTLSHAITASPDANYPTNLSINPVNAAITDNDTAGVAIVQSGGTTDIAEGGATDTYTLALTTVPSGAVQITVTADAQTEVSLDGVNFAASQNFSRSDTTSQTVTVRAIDDLVDEASPHNGILSHAVTGAVADPNYPTTLVIADVTAVITDDDTAGVTVTASGGDTSVAEGGATDTYTLQLDSMPTGAVEITVTADTQIEVSIDGVNFAGSQSFSRSDTSAQTVTVRAIDDLDIEANPHTGLLTHAVTGAVVDPNYPTTTVVDPLTATITDNDVAGVTVTESGGSTDVTEDGATDTYSLALDTLPTGPVEITVTAGTQTEVSIDGVNFAASQTFTRADTTPQTVTVRAIDDLVDETSPHPGSIGHAITGAVADANYPTTLPIGSVAPQITDNDAAGVAVVESGKSTDIAEGGATDSYTLALTTVPSAPVELTVTADAQTEVSLDGVSFGASQVFSRTDTSPQTVTVRAVDDSIDELSPHTGLITQAVTGGTDPNYPATLSITDVVAAITDDDTAGVTVVESAGSTAVTEDGTQDSYTIQLDSLPTGPVELTVSADTQTEISLDGTQFAATQTFTRGDQTPQTITVRAVDDLIIELDPHPGTLTHAVTGAVADPNYPLTTSIDPVAVSIADNDVAGVTVTQSGGSTDVTEAGTTDTYTLALDTIPTDPVALTATADDQLELSLNGTDFAPSVTVPLTDVTPTTITVRAIDDEQDEAKPHLGTIDHTIIGPVLDGNYPTTLAIASVSAQILDNDSAGVTVIESDGSTEVDEAGTNDSYTVALDTVPTAPVTISIEAGDQVEISLDGADFASAQTFTRTDQTPQTVTLRAVDDGLVEPNPHFEELVHRIEAPAGDPDYPTDLPIAGVDVTIEDNDVPGLGISVESQVLTVDGLPTRYQVFLSAAPASPVTVTLESDDNCQVTPSVLTFNPDGAGPPLWSEPQTVEVRALGGVGARCFVDHIATGSGYDQNPVQTVEFTIIGVVPTLQTWALMVFAALLGGLGIAWNRKSRGLKAR